MAYKCILGFYLFCCSGIGTMAQESPHFIEKLTTTEGLSSNRVNDMVQDDNGFLWIATSDGLNRFDGTEVTKYYYRDSGNALPNNYVYCLKKLPGNYLSMCTQAGLSFYNGNDGTFRNFYYPGHRTLDEYNNAIVQLETDTRGNLWAVSGNCIFVFDAQRRFKKIFASPFTEADATRKRLRYAEKVFPLQGGRVLICLYNGWYVPAVLPARSIAAQADNLGFVQDMAARLAACRYGAQPFTSTHIFKVFDTTFFLPVLSRTGAPLLVMKTATEQSRCFFPLQQVSLCILVAAGSYD